MKRTALALSVLAVLLTLQPAQGQNFCPADVTGDLTVDVNDLLKVITDWGPCAFPPCMSDVNGDILINITDLLGVISAWGSCQPYFELEVLALADGDAGTSGKGAAQNDDGDEPENIAYCTYRVDAVAPGSVLAVGDIICTSCPLTWMNACPNLLGATFKGVPGAPAAMSTGVKATSIGNGFCQGCPAAAGGKRYHRTG
jgi:hypothetical protein